MLLIVISVNGIIITQIKNKTVFVDEFSMVPNKFMTLLYKLWSQYGIKIYMFGEPNQCNPVERGSHISYNYLESPACLQMCPTWVELEYIDESGRYDKETFLALNFFFKNRYISKRTKNKRANHKIL